MYMYVYTYWFRFHLPGSNASAHIKLMCSFILLQDVTPPGDWLDVAFQKAQWQWANPTESAELFSDTSYRKLSTWETLPFILRALHLDQGHHT